MTRRGRAAALTVLLWTVLPCNVSIGAAPRARKPVTHTVVIEGTSFRPQVLTVKVGDSVVWNNKDPFSHTATSTAEGFDSRGIAAGTTWKYKAAKKGDFAYICTYHTTMKGRLVVR